MPLAAKIVRILNGHKERSFSLRSQREGCVANSVAAISIIPSRDLIATGIVDNQERIEQGGHSVGDDRDLDCLADLARHFESWMNATRTSALLAALTVASTPVSAIASPELSPPPLSADKSIIYDYPIVYVRVPRPYPVEYAGINHLNQAGLHQANAPGAELRLLHPDGRDESLVAVTEQESITDPVVSFDGEWVYFAKFHHMARGEAHMSKLRSREGADLYKVHVTTRKVIRLSQQQRTPNTGAIAEDEESHPRGVHNLAPCPVPGGKVVFVSDRNGIRGVREQTQPALQLFVMDDDGSNIELIGSMNLGTALHPVALLDGRVMFSSLETQGLRSDERWGIWAIHPDGTNWGPLTSALGSPPGQAVHFQTQLSDESIVVESYYQTGSTDGFGTYWKFPLHVSANQPAFLSAAKRFAPVGITDLTLFASFQDIRPNRDVGDVSARMVMGNVTHPSGAPDNHRLTNKTAPLFTTKTHDQSRREWDQQKRTGVRSSKKGLRNVEFYRDIKPILDRSCVACHTSNRAKPGHALADKHHLILDDYRPIEKDWRVPWTENITLPARFKLPHTYVRLTQYSWAFQARRSPLIWKIYGKRLDGFHNDDISSPPLDYHDERDILDWCHRRTNKERDVDYEGTAMPPPKGITGE